VEFNPIDVEVQHMGKLKRPDAAQLLTEEARAKHAENLKLGRRLTRMRQCRAERSLIATTGQEVDLQVWDLMAASAEPVFRAKNVRPDFLELRVPVWNADLAFLSHKTVATASRHGHIRLPYPCRI
jgi:ribosome biogenesis protein NSA1